MRYYDPDADDDPRDRGRRQDNWVERETFNIPGFLPEEVASDADDKLWSDHDTTDEESQFMPPDLCTSSEKPQTDDAPPGMASQANAEATEGTDAPPGVTSSENQVAVDGPPGMAPPPAAPKPRKQPARLARVQVPPNSVLARRVRTPRTMPGSVKTPIPAAQTRLDPITDCGITQARESDQPFFCWRFARGFCTFGHNCKWLHRMPTPKDHLAGYINIQTDIFGRNRRNRDDLANTTLFVTGIAPLGHDRMGGWPTVERQAWTQFSPFGEIESIKGLPNQGSLFVRYRTRISAEFAKEAMTGQSLQQLGDGEVLRTKWAKEDPDPVMRQQHLFETLSKQWDSEDLRPLTLVDPTIQRNRLEQSKYVKLTVTQDIYVPVPAGSSQTPFIPAVTTMQYPDTDQQYPSAAQPPVETKQQFHNPDWQWNPVTWKWEPVQKEEEEASGLGALASYASDSDEADEKQSPITSSSSSSSSSSSKGEAKETQAEATQEAKKRRPEADQTEEPSTAQVSEAPDSNKRLKVSAETE